MENYIKQIEDILKKTGWTQTQLADQMGVTFATVNRWLNGHTKPHPAQIRQIDRLFKDMVGITPLSRKEIMTVIEEIASRKAKFKNIKKIFSVKEIIQDFLLELTYNSDAIEGSTLNKKETEAIIFDKATIKDKSLIEHLEATHHACVLKDIFEDRLSADITEGLVKNLHKALMQGIREDAGQYAKHPRAIRGVDLLLPQPEDIPEEMELYFKKVNFFKGHPIEHIARMHAEFEAIHPFGDGNGRVGRLMMIIQLIHKGYAPCVIRVNEKAKYYEYLQYAQKKSETHFVKFLADSVLEGYKIVEKYLK